jgi:hypothetical protein
MLLNHHRVQAGIVLGIPVDAMPVAVSYVHTYAVMAGELMEIKAAQRWAVAQYEDLIIFHCDNYSFMCLSKLYIQANRFLS